jgi:chaperone BCS1
MAEHTNHRGDFDPASLNFAPSILETFIPGYSIISKFILHTFGFDIGIIVSTGLLLATFATALRFFWIRLKNIALEYFVAGVTITDQDDMFEHCLAWSAKQRVGMTARTIKAVSKSIGNDDEDELEVNDEQAGTGLFHTRRMAKVPPNYEPYFGSYYFWRGWRPFIFERGRSNRQQSPWARKQEDEIIHFKTIGWRTEPLKELLKDIKEWAVQQENVFTVIRRPSPKDRGRPGQWLKAMERPSRPMETVVLDPLEQAKLIADVNDYLLPSTRRWYARRGVPYRRGYLFHGPPGTGKSSLSFALAGVFGLEVYLISLRDQTMTESDLMSYFNNLPRRCIVLLEDIDTAGLEKRSMGDGKNGNSAAKRARAAAAKLAVAPASVNDEEEEEPNTTGISLSGLLNAIDGVASHEGRVLVMTTNRPEKLDEALIRPGRVDFQVRFTLATKHQMREIFIRMYLDDESSTGNAHDTKVQQCNESKTGFMNGSITHSNGHAVSGKKPLANSHSRGSSIDNLQHSTQELLKSLLEAPHAHYTRADLEKLGDIFIQKVPEHAFSPAEVQNFLIPRKKDPRKAVDAAESWFTDLLKHKEAKRQSEEDILVAACMTPTKEAFKHDSPMQSDHEA